MTGPLSSSALEARDFACILIKTVDYESQLTAIKALLDSHRQIARARNERITQIELEIPRYKGIDSVLAENERVDLLHRSVYEDAAYSMAAIGMLAPFIETIFSHTFHTAQAHYDAAPAHSPDHPRWKVDEHLRWDCRWFYKEGEMQNNLVEGILQLSRATGLANFLPPDLRKTLQAVFGYRNKMLHHGFEWPIEEREKFCRRASNEWPQDWFIWAISGDDPWVCYMTDSLINECLTRIDQILDAIGQFVEKELPG